MATLVKLPSGKVINFDNVVLVKFEEDTEDCAGCANVVFEHRDTLLDAADRDALRAWLDWQARDIEAELAGRKSLVMEA